MKPRYLFFIICSFFILPLTSKLKAQVNQRDSMALVDLYNSMGGGFRFHPGWLQGAVSTWSGVTLSNNRVVGIQLAYDNVHGTLSKSLGNLDSLISLDISHESIGLTGSIPSSIGNLQKLTYLALTDNSLSGSIPSSIGNAKSLQRIYISTDALTGGIPSSIGNLQNLVVLDFSSNALGGSIPSSIGSLKNLDILNFANNKLSGPIPGSLGQCTMMTYLDLDNNQITGNIPATFKNLTNISTFYAGGNHLSGGLGNVFIVGSQLTDLGLGSNHFIGQIPASISNLEKLKTLSLYNNQFSGPVPTSITKLQQLQSFSLSVNQLSGKITDNLSTMPALSDFDLSYNRLTGSIPATLGKSKTLKEITLSHNSLTGMIPASLGKAPLVILDVSYNQLSGDVSSFLNPSTAYYPEDLYINNNQLYCSTNPQFTQLRKKGTNLTAQDNLFTFDGLEFLQEKYSDGTDFNVRLDSQAILPIHINNNLLSVNAGGTLSNITYVWHKTGDTATTTITGDSTFQPTVNGKYYAIISDSKITNLYSDTKLYTDTITFTKATACPSTIVKNLNISIYPNPVRDMIQVNGLNDKSSVKVTLADMSGYVWMSTMARNQTYIKFNVSRLKPGNYLINVNDEKGAMKTIQFLKE